MGRKTFPATLLPILLLSTGSALSTDAVPPVNDRAPRITRVIPNSIDACSLQEGGKIVVMGDFTAGARLLLDGAAMAAERIGDDFIFTLPSLPGGLHQIEVVGPGNHRSVPHAVFIDTAPKITGISTGEDQVTAYEVIVNGENFLFDSTLVVNGAALRPARAEDPNAPPLPLGGKDYVRYENCSTLVYIRHPVTRERESVTLRVVNPGGEQSREYAVELP